MDDPDFVAFLAFLLGVALIIVASVLIGRTLRPGKRPIVLGLLSASVVVLMGMGIFALFASFVLARFEPR
jgi:hypothetical protein